LAAIRRDKTLVEIRAHRSLDTIMASDHLPVTGIVEV
jgi:hypothetical protein